MSLFTIKYAPQKVSDIIGQSLGLAQLKDFITNYKQQKRKAALIYGPIGCGKTASVYALAQELKYDILEINSSDIRNEANMNSFLGAALGQQSLFFTPKIILIDEIDNISGTHDRGCIPTLVKALEKSQFPVILTANDIYDSKFSGLRKAVLMIEYTKLDYKIVAEKLTDICKLESIAHDEKAINSLARRNDGDLRAALIDLQICASLGAVSSEIVKELSDRKRTETIINALRIIFKSSSVENALLAIDDIDADMDEIFLWIDENLPKEYLQPAELARAYEHLARAQVFRSRIRRWQHWRFLTYVSNLLTAGISSAKDKRNTDFIEYKPTTRILKIWMANQKLAKRKEIAKKLAAATHTSAKSAFSQVAYVEQMIKGTDRDKIIKDLDLTEEEVEWLTK